MNQGNILELFEQAVDKFSSNTAIKHLDTSISFAQLEASCNNLANFLLLSGAGKGSLVAIFSDETVEVITSIIAILKAGCVFVPLDTSLPEMRLQSMVEVAKPEYFITHQRYATLITTIAGDVGYSPHLVLLDQPHTESEATRGSQAQEQPQQRIGYKGYANRARPKSEWGADDMCYIYFTSGTTGKPKAIAGRMKGIDHFIRWEIETLELDEGVRVSQLLPVTFDGLMRDIFVGLAAGGRVCIPGGREQILDAKVLMEWIEEEGISLIHCVPTMFRGIVNEEMGKEKFGSLKNILMAGEGMGTKEVERWMEVYGERVKLVNLYGTSETTMAKFAYFVKREDTKRRSIPIGKPIAGARALILNDKGKPCPPGAVGEIYIKTEYRTLGYYNQPELTREVFVQDPLSKDPDEIVYKTGDMGRVLKDGNFEILGRKDQQVKIRGVRVEIGEIENLLRGHEAVKDVAIVDRVDESGNKSLVAYVIPRSDNAPTIAGRQRYVLPNNMAVVQQNKDETDFFYQQTFVDRAGFRNGITLCDGDCVFDVGANIGLFTIFVQQACKDVSVYAFEPGPSTFEALSINTSLYSPNAKLFQCGFSKFNQQNLTIEAEALKYYINGVVKESAEYETITCQQKTLSELIKQNQIERIDLLKMDAKTSEYDVLDGIDPEDWEKIKQVTIEAYDIDGRVGKIASLLEEQGFNVLVESDVMHQGTNLSNIYAVHRSYLDRRQSSEDVCHRALPVLSISVLSTRELRNFLKEQLPDAMIPSTFIMMESLPRTLSGKLDKRALPPPELMRLESSASYAAPRTPTEEILAGIWAEVLGLERVGLQENFFELGGHSLRVTQVLSRVRAVFGVGISLHSIFETPTVVGLAEKIDIAMMDEQNSEALLIKKISRDVAIPLSFAQQRMWFINQLEPGNCAYNMPTGVRLSGRIDVKALEDTIKEIIRRHEVLRTTFAEQEARPIQVIAKTVEVKLPVVDLTELEGIEREAEAQRLVSDEAQQPFDLASGPLLRTCLLRLAADDHVVILTMHHIISDGWSMGVLIREVTLLYQAYCKRQPSPLADLPIQYADYAQWQREWLQGPVLEEQLGYWKRHLTGAPALLEMPTDRPRPAVQSYRGASEAVVMSKELTSKLKELSRRESATMFMTLLAGFKAMLYRYTGEEDIVVATGIANRTRIEGEGLIGFFVNTLVLRTDLGGNPSIQEVIRRVREVTLGGYAHQDVPFELIVEEMEPERNASYTPMFQVMFVLQNAPEEELEIPGLILTPMIGENNTSKFDLYLALTEIEEGLAGSLEYSTDLFDASSIKQLVKYYLTMLEYIADNPDKPIRSISMIPQEENLQYIYEFNNG